MTLAEYIKKRNGVPMGHPKSFRNNLYRSFGAKNFSTFWNYWNPVFGYYLGRKIFKPLKNYFPSAIALLITFLFCGLIHDLVTIIFRGETYFFFSIWFIFMGLGVLITRRMKHNFIGKPWIVRVLINLVIISTCLILSLYAKKYLNLGVRFSWNG